MSVSRLSSNTLEDSSLHVTHTQSHVEWKIEKFSSQPKQNDYLVISPYFHFSNSLWSFLLYPNGQTSYKSEGWIGLYLNKETSTEECYVAFTIGFRKNDGSELGAPYSKKLFGKKGNGFGCARAFERSSLESSNDILASDGSLTAFCTIRVENTKDDQSQTTSPYDIPSLAEDLKRLYLDKQHADIKFKLKDKELVAHKCILAARSKVFAAMFEHDMAEKSSGTVEVNDSNPEHFEHFMIHLYSGKLDVVSSSNALSLYKVADKYDAVELKKECSRIMAHELNVESFCDIVHLATMYGESHLLTTATAFLTKNLVTILETPKWQEFLAENPTLGNELILKAVRKPEKI